jgi:hypothetical protein
MSSPKDVTALLVAWGRGGLWIEEAAEVLQLSPATVSREWSMAKAWLYKEMGGSAA